MGNQGPKTDEKGEKKTGERRGKVVEWKEEEGRDREEGKEGEERRREGRREGGRGEMWHEGSYQTVPVPLWFSTTVSMDEEPSTL